MFGYGAVCDVGILSSHQNFRRIRLLLDGNLFIPSVTYSWLARDKLIQVRNHVIKYTFVNQLVRDGEIFALYLPDILDELARRLLFLGDREIPLTDLRTILLASHLGFPVVCIGEELCSEISENLNAKLVGRECLEGENQLLRRAIQQYRRFRSNNSLPCTTRDSVKNCAALNIFHADLSPVLDEYAEEQVLSPEAILKLEECSSIAVLSIPTESESS